MSAEPNETASAAKVVVCPRPWSSPRLAELPKLSALTLASPIGGGGGTGGGGSTVFGLLLALAALASAAGCAGDRTGGPDEARAPTLTRAVPCAANVIARTVTCGGGPNAAPEILGGNGSVVALRSTNVSYNSGTEEFSFDVSVQNLGAQTIGSPDGVGTTGIDVFFESAPVATSGTGVISVANATGTGTFTGAGQSYFHYDTLLLDRETTLAQPWVLSIPVAVTTFAFTVMVSAEVPDAGGVLLWEQVRPPDSYVSTLADIAANSATDAMAVGANGFVLLKNAAGWRVLSPQVTDHWVGVEAVGNGEYIGATSQGGVYLYSSKTWRSLHQVGFTITTLTASSSQNIMVAGVNMMAWWGSNGTSVVHNTSSGGTPFVASAWHALGNEFMAGSEAGYRWKGNFLAGAGGLTSDLSIPFNALAGTATDNVLMARNFGGGGSLTDAGTNFEYVPYMADSLITAVTYGAGGVGALFWRATQSNSTEVTRLSSFNGSWTSRAVLPDPGTVTQMIDDKNGGLYLLAGGEGILRWNGAALVPEYTPIDGSYQSVWGDDSSAIVGGLGVVYQYDDGAWTERDPGLGAGALTVVAASGPDDQYAAGGMFGSGAAHWDGVSWSAEAALSGKGITAFSVAPGFAAAIEGKNIWLKSGGTWTQQVDAGIPNDSMMAVWAGSASDVRVLTKLGLLVRFDGVSWSQEFPFGGLAGGSMSIAGTGANDVWAAHKDSLHHWDGVSWSAKITVAGVSFISGLTTTAPGHVLVRDPIVPGVRAVTLSAQHVVNFPGSAYPFTIGGDHASGLWALGAGNLLMRGRR